MNVVCVYVSARAISRTSVYYADDDDDHDNDDDCTKLLHLLA